MVFRAAWVPVMRVMFIGLGLVGLYLAYVGWKLQRRTPKGVVGFTEDYRYAAGH